MNWQDVLVGWIFEGGYDEELCFSMAGYKYFIERFVDESIFGHDLAHAITEEFDLAKVLDCMMEERKILYSDPAFLAGKKLNYVVKGGMRECYKTVGGRRLSVRMKEGDDRMVLKIKADGMLDNFCELEFIFHQYSCGCLVKFVDFVESEDDETSQE